jgi:hypothetical protein
MSNPSSNGGNTDTESILQFLISMNQALLTQTRTTNQNTAQVLVVMKSLQNDIQELIRVLDITRERRFEEEINTLERQMTVLQSQIDEKKNAKVELKTTSEKIKLGVKAELAEQAKKKQIDWLAVRQVMINAAFGALAVGIVWGIVTNLPNIGIWLKEFFGR